MAFKLIADSLTWLFTCSTLNTSGKEFQISAIKLDLVNLFSQYPPKSAPEAGDNSSWGSIREKHHEQEYFSLKKKDNLKSSNPALAA